MAKVALRFYLYSGKYLRGHWAAFVSTSSMADLRYRMPLIDSIIFSPPHSEIMDDYAALVDAVNSKFRPKWDPSPHPNTSDPEQSDLVHTTSWSQPLAFTSDKVVDSKESNLVINADGRKPLTCNYSHPLSQDVNGYLDSEAESHTTWRFVRTAYYILLFLCTAGSLVIQILTLLSPTPSKITHLSFMKVISTNAVHASYPDVKVLDGPSAEFGLFGSCAWSNSTGDAHCTPRRFVPIYDFALLGPHSPSYLISPPTAIPAICLSIGIICTVTFIGAYLLQCKRGRVGRSKVGNRETLAMHSAILAFVFNLVAMIVVFMYMDKNIRDFNLRIKYEGPTNTNLRAVRGTAFVICPIGVVLLVAPFVDEIYRRSMNNFSVM